MKLVIVCCGFLVIMCHSKALQSLTYPRSIRIDTIDEPPSFDISWKKVQSVDDEDPIIGYKVKVLEVKKIKRIIHKFDSSTNEVKKIEVEEYPKINVHEIPDGNLTELMTPASDKPKVRFEGWKPWVAYQITVLAYTENQEGPTSAPIRVRVHGSR